MRKKMSIVTLLLAGVALVFLACPGDAAAQPNDDGTIDKNERPRGPKGDRGPLPGLHTKIREADTDGDGQVTHEEFMAAVPEIAEQIFKHLDRNEDGVLNPDDHPEGGRRGMRGPHGVGSLREADANDDHQVSFEELTAVKPEITQEQFDEMDRNGDGVLSRDDHPEGDRGGRGGREGKGGRGGKGGLHTTR